MPVGPESLPQPNLTSVDINAIIMASGEYMHGILERRKVLKWLCKLLSGLFLAGFYPISRAKAKKLKLMILEGDSMKLPRPKTDGGMPLETCIKTRRTVRSFTPQPLRLEELSQLLWSAQGITEENGYKRAAPSAGALYPIDVYAALGPDSVEGLNGAVYQYLPATHAVKTIAKGDLRRKVAEISLSQMWMARAPVIIVITAEYPRITVKYKRRGVRYAMIEAGHIGQNIFLQAEALGLGAGIVGAFDDKKLIHVMEISGFPEPLLIMPVGHIKYPA